MPTYLFCNTTDALTEAHRDLLQASAIYVDCEGLTLGKRGGRLSLITMGAENHGTPPPTIYVFDAYTLGGDHVRPIFDLLESPSIRKIFYDGRMDASALYHEHGVNIVNVLDLQLAEVLSRAGGEERRIAMLRSYLRGYVWRKGEDRSLYVLASLRQSVTERGLGTKKDHEEIRVDHAKWLKRPVAPKSLDYAAKDVRLMSLLYIHFTKNYLASELPAMSQRYLALGTESPPVHRNDIFRSNAILPMGVLNLSSGRKSRCGGCKRLLSKDYFSTDGAYCRACKAMTLRREKQKKKQK